MQAVIHNIWTESWDDRAHFDDELRARGLRELGLSENQIHEIEEKLDERRGTAQHESLVDRWRDPRYQLYRRGSRSTGDETFFEAPTPGELRAFEKEIRDRRHKWDAEHARVYLEKLRDVFQSLLGFITLKVEETKTIERKVPLFMLHAPNVHGSEVLYQDTQSEEQSQSYALSILGAGLGQTTNMQFSISSTLVSRAGAYKRVYIPITLQTSLVGVYEKEERVREFGRLEYVVPSTRAFEIGVEEMTREHFMEFAGPGSDDVRAYRLAGDPQGSVHVFKTSLGATKEIALDVAVEAFNTKATSKVQLTRNTEVSLEFKLPSGFDYEMRPILGGLGIVWADPVGQG